MRLKTLLLFLIFHQCVFVFSQETKTSNQNLFEDQNGKLITNPAEQEEYLVKRQKATALYTKNHKTSAANQVPSQLCSNGGFEEFVNENGVNVLKNFQYTVADPIKPIQCKSVTQNANLSIKQYNPNDIGLMASTVPANFIDEFIGPIDAFDQYCLKLNYKESGSTMTLVQAQRFKTDNETVLKFNYKTVLQSVAGSGHLNEQPYFKARIINKSGVVVSEFCLTGDPNNCIFTQAPVLQNGSIILYTKNWQSGTLDISSIPNNENFTVEFMTTRCGLGGHFGYSYIDDICMSHSDENLQGSIELDPLFQSCPTAPISICGGFTIPNSGDVKATVKSIELKIYDSANKLIYNTTKTASIDLDKKRFCFDLDLNSLPNTATESYNVSASINYDIDITQITCTGTNFNEITDDDANIGWDITFLNCDPKCPLKLETASLSLCDNNKDGKEFFDLTNLDSLVAANQTGITFSYFAKLDDATADKNPIANFKNFDTFSTTLFVRATLDLSCYKIIAVKLIVRNPTANISGVLNVCNGGTVLTATKGVSYLWSNGETTQSITATKTGLYSVTVTDVLGCKAVGDVTLIPNQVAAQPNIEITQPTCSQLKGSVKVTSRSSEYSFDNGKTWTTNNEMLDLPIGTYYIKIRTASGCESYGTKINLVPFLSSFPYYSKIDPKFCGDTGSITITTTASSYSFDDGITWGSSNTMDNLPLGSYHIRVKDALGCISNYNNVELNSQFLPAPKYTITNPYCSKLGSITITTPATEYSFDGGTVWQTSNTMTNLKTGSYVISIKNDMGCTSAMAYIYLTSLENTYPDYQKTEAGCNSYASIEIKTPGDLYSFDNGAHWTTNPKLENLNGATFYQIMVQKEGTCFSRSVNIGIYNYFIPNPVVNDYEITYCDDLNDGSELVDLTPYTSNITPNPASNQYEYYASSWGAANSDRNEMILDFKTHKLSNSNNTVYVKVISQYGCSSIASLKFIFLNAPKIIMEDKYPLCVDKSVYINAGMGYNSYLWSNGEKTQIINLTKPGNYWVNVTEKHGTLICDSTKKFTVFMSSPATITNIKTEDWTDGENIISVYKTGLGDYEYSLDDRTYQDNNIFTNLPDGEYTVYVRDKFGCGTTPEKVYLLMYPRYFTPNGDGHNDTWKVKFSDIEVGLTVEIFDRHGKLIKTLATNTDSWNGTFNGAELPSTDYWFVVTRANGTQHKGHFSLKR